MSLPHNTWPQVFWWALLAALVFGILLPFWVMLTGALTSQAALSATRLDVFASLFPRELTWGNFLTVFEKVPFVRYSLNSLLVSTLASLGQVALSAMAAFGFAKLRFPGRDKLFFLVLITMMIPPQVNIVPLFLVMKTLHWVDTLWAIIIPACFGAFGIFLLRQWFMSIPSELDDAAALDGASALQFFWRVALPLVTPALVALGIYAFIVNWNSFMWPLVVLQSDQLRTLPLGLAELKNTYRDAIDWGVMMAACATSIMPILLLYAFGQKHLTKNLVQGAVKG